MDPRPPAAIVFSIATGAVVMFQLALALGAPGGAYALGGRYRIFPTPLSVGALVQATVLVRFIVLELSTVGIFALDVAQRTPPVVWLPVVVAAVALVLNLITPSPGERRLW